MKKVSKNLPTIINKLIIFKIKKKKSLLLTRKCIRFVLASGDRWGSSINIESEFLVICPNFSPLLGVQIF